MRAARERKVSRTGRSAEFGPCSARASAVGTWVVLTLLGVALGYAGIGCSSGPSKDVPEPGPIEGEWAEIGQSPGGWNVLLLTLDTTRRDRLGCYGYGEPTSPTLDSLANAGVVFENAVTPVPVTLPAHATILTGMDPQEHGVRDNGAFVLPEGIETVAEVLAAAGYSTRATVGAYPVAKGFGLEQGFRSYDDHFPAASRSRMWQTAQRTADQVTDAALAWAHEHAEEPFFHWVHYFDPHFPYEPPEPQASKFESPYDGEIAFMDEQIGRLIAGLRQMGLLERTWILAVADHGEALGEHGEPGHSMLLYAATQYVPCILVPPAKVEGRLGSLRGRRIEDLVRLCDLAPTLLNLLGFEASKFHGTGISLVPLLLGGGEGAPVAYMETLVPALEYGWAELHGVRTLRWCFIDAPEPELYDVFLDPHEEKNLLASETEIAERLRRWCDLLSGGGGEMSPGTAGAEAAARLRSLGYIGGSHERPSKDAAKLRDPKSSMDLFVKINQARSAIASMHYMGAQQTLNSVLERDPGNPAALRLLLTVRLALWDAEGALEIATDLLERFPDDLEIVQSAARAYGMAERWEEARRLLEQATQTFGCRVELSEALAGVLLRLGRIREARGALEEALAKCHGHADALAALAEFEWRQGRRETAREMAERILAEDESNARAHAVLGEYYWWSARKALAEGRNEEGMEAQKRARAHVARALELDPMQPTAAFRRGWELRLEKRTEEAREFYERALERAPDWAEAHINLGNVLADMNERQMAMYHFDVARKLGADDPAFLANYGVALAQMGRRKEALEVWKQALSRATDPTLIEGLKQNIRMVEGN